MNKKKNFFKTKEMIDLFDTTIDTLRYYEKIGLLHPIRNESNNYRYFTYQDVETLALVMELVKLHFPLSEIKELVTIRTVNNTLALLHKEDAYLQKQIAELKSTQKNIRSRISFMNHILYETPLSEIQLQHFPIRDCIKISDENIDEDIFNVEVVKYMNETAQSIPIIGTSDCYALDIETFKKEGKIKVCGVFFYSEDTNYHHNYQLPAGYYLTLAFPSSEGYGDDNTYPTLQRLIDFIEKYHIIPRSDIYSFFMIDEPESSLKEEHIIELQVHIDDTDIEKLKGVLQIPDALCCLSGECGL